MRSLVRMLTGAMMFMGLELVFVMAYVVAYPYSQSGSFGNFGSDFPTAPMIPWIGVPQRWFGRALYIPNPPVYAQPVVTEQNIAFQNYRFSYFYQTTTVAPSAGAGGQGSGSSGEGTVPGGSNSANNAVTLTGSASVDALNNETRALGLTGQGLGLTAQVQKGPKQCVAINAVNSLGSHHGVCMQDSDIARKCSSQISGDGKGCGLTETCCVDYSPPKEVIEFLKRQKAIQQ